MTVKVRPVYVLQNKDRNDYYSFSPDGPAKTVFVQHHAADGTVIDNDIISADDARQQWKQLEAGGFLCTDPKFRPKQ